MTKKIEILLEAIQRGEIRRDQHFSVALEDGKKTPHLKLVNIASQMRTAAVARGLTTEIFDTLIAAY